MGKIINLSSLNGRNGFRLDGTLTYDMSGGIVSGAGDINGDGLDDLIRMAAFFLVEPEPLVVSK